MNKILKRLRQEKLNKDQIAIVWLCQAGFLIKDSNDEIIAIDPYLSHAGEDLMNFIRLSPSVIDPEELEVDAYIVSHCHFDHLDPVTVKETAKRYNPKFYVPVSCKKMMEKWGVDLSNTTVMDENSDAVKITEDISLKAVYADHGEKDPDAVGYWITLGDINIYFTGDTSYRPDKMDEVKGKSPDIIIPPVNGAFGNLDYSGSVDLAKYCDAKHMIPCHFWTFLEHLGNPELIVKERDAKGADVVVDFISPGEVYKFTKNQEEKIKR